MAEIQIKKVQKKFGNVEVLKGISLDIQNGEFIVLVGPSGCGKSTLLNLVAGLESLTSGDIHIGGRLVNRVPPKDRDIAMVFQSYALYPNMNVRQNLSFGLETRRIPKAEREDIINNVARMLQIEALLDRRPSQLSGGQRQRVAMGRALARNPSVFLFDEPLSNLDAKLRIEMRTEIKRLHQNVQTTMIYVTHDQIEAMTLANRIAVMKDGVIQQLGTPQEVYENPENMFVAGFIGSPPMNFISCKIAKQGDNAGIVLRFESGEAVTLPVEQDSLQAWVDREVIMGVRPEQITHRIVEQQTQTLLHSLSCKVRVTEPTGPDTLVFVQMNGKDVTCRVQPNEAKEAGEMIDLSINLSKTVFFDPQNQKRIL